MSDVNTVSVLIMGQEYTLSSDMPKDYVMKLASRVDEVMNLVANGNQTLSKTAVLAAMLITNDYYQAKEQAEANISQIEILKNQAENYSKLWEDVKSSFAAYKEEQETTIAGLRQTIVAQEERYESSQIVPTEAQQRIEELESRSRDIESSFFDLQMENIRLKNELENYKNRGF